MASPQKILIVSDSVFFDQRHAQRTAYLGMIDHIAEQSGVASALVAQALQHPSGPVRAPGNAPHPPEHRDEAALYETARTAVSFYLTKRSEATRPPGGLADALTTMRSNLATRRDGSGESVVGVSALPPAALDRYLGKTELRQTFDFIYSLGRPASESGASSSTPMKDDWIRQIPRTLTWPSPVVMQAICAIHHVKPEEAVLIGGNLGEEVGPALDLGMRAVYVRLGILDRASPDIDGPLPPTPAGSRRPDGIVTRIQDLPRLPLFQSVKEGEEGQTRHPTKTIDRER